MDVILNSKKGRKISINIDRPELILGATAIFVKNEDDLKDTFINPITNEELTVIKGNENRLFVPAHIQEDFEYAAKNNLKIKQVIAPYFYGVGEEAIRDDVKTQNRHSVIVVIKDVESNSYLCLDCKNRECKSFVLGGVENEERIIDAALREVREETGYINVQIDKVSDFSLYNHFYAGYKGVNRYARLDVLFGHLIDHEREELSKEENDKHLVKWIKKEELKNFINISNNLYVLDEIFDGPKAYTLQQGKIINSNEFDKLDINEARLKIQDIIKNIKN